MVWQRLQIIPGASLDKTGQIPTTTSHGKFESQEEIKSNRLSCVQKKLTGHRVSNVQRILEIAEQELEEVDPEQKKKKKKMWEDGIMHSEFCMKLYRI